MNKNLDKLMKQDFSHPETDDPDFQSKIYKKREYYYHKIPHREILKDPEEIRKYQDEYCSGAFKLYSHQAFLSNFINPNTPYKGVLIYHGVGTGKCLHPDSKVKYNNVESNIKDIWDNYKTDITLDDDFGEWSIPNVQLYVKSYDEERNEFIEGKVNRLYRQRVSEKLRKLELENGLIIIATKIHKFYTKRGWTFNLSSFDEIMTSNGSFEKIKKITYIAYEEYVYDLEVEKYHNYIANEILCHNTCSAVSIAEGFKDMVKKYNTKIYILTPGTLIKENWKKEIATLCTGETYMKDTISKSGYVNELEVKRAKKNAINLAMQYYKIISYKSFYKKVLGEKIIERKVSDDKKKVKMSYRKNATGEVLREIAVDKIDSLDNTIIIVDEAHNITGNERGEALKSIIDKSKNLKVILLTATPMKNLADDIIELINFIRPRNDPIIRDKIFTSEKNYQMELRPGGEEYFKRMIMGYVSHFRGANPLVFAKQVDEGEIPPGLLFTKVVRCEMDEFQKSVYYETLKDLDDTLDRKSTAVANFVFPGLSEDRKSIMGYYSNEGISTIKVQLNNYGDILLDMVNKQFFKGKVQNINSIMTESKATKNISGIILKYENLKTFSTKFYEAFKNIRRLVVQDNGAGTAFIYSNLVKVGIELFQEILLVNGYLEYNEEGNYKLFDDTVCYYCGLPFKDHDKTSVMKKHSHKFHPATFLPITGASEDQTGDAIPEEKKEIIDNVFNNVGNKEGKHLKFILGSKVMTEGMTLENVREVHILDVHYNLGKIYQVIGRAIRQCKHYNVTTPENPNPEVHIFKYVVSMKEQLTTEEELYRKAELKYILIKKMERFLKEASIDCPINYHGNIFPEELEQYKKCININDYIKNNEKDISKLCPERCDFENCDYKCYDEKLNLKYYDKNSNLYKKIAKENLDYSTFSYELGRDEIEYSKDKIKELYRLKYVYLLDYIIDYVKNSYEGENRDLFDEFFVYKALDELIPITENDFNNFKDTIFDKYNNSGYLIYRNKYYIFQPFDQPENIPMYYRSSYNKDLFNELNLITYLKSTDIYKKVRLLLSKDDKYKEIINKSKYDFDTVKDYYDARKEFEFVGIIDRSTQSSGLENTKFKDVFKIRPKRESILDKKRGTGIPTLTGAVCNTSKDKKYLLDIAKTVGVDMKSTKITRTKICNEIRERLLYLEKYSTGKNKMTYLMIPANHATYKFPLNLEDRIKYITTNLKEEIAVTIDISVTKDNGGIFEGKRDKKLPRYILMFNDSEKLKQYNNNIKLKGFELVKDKWQLIIE
jgi:hypothetical protein